MTDKEIYKAYECCITGGVMTMSSTVRCGECPYYHRKSCAGELKADVLGLLHRQQTKIARLEMEKEQLEIDVSNANCNFGNMELLYKDARAEAIKEFAEKLKAKSAICVASNNGQEIYSTKMYSIMAYTLDDLVAGMVGADNEN